MKDIFYFLRIGVKFLILSFAAVLILMGGIGLFRHFNNIKEYRNFEKRACIGTAKVIRIVSNNMRQSYIVYQFKDDNSLCHNKCVSINFEKPGTLKEGDLISVLYDPANPDDVRYAFLEKFAFKQRLNVRLVAIGTIIAVLGCSGWRMRDVTLIKK